MSARAPRRKRVAAAAPVTVWDFVDEFLVVCPACSERAVVTAAAAARPPRIACARCGLSRDWTSSRRGVLTSARASTWPAGQYAIGDSADPYFHLPLWLQAPCAGRVLWAFNARHLAFLRDYVAATDRRTVGATPRDPKNALLASRLPRWVKLATNRSAVLRTIARLEDKLGAQGLRGRPPEPLSGRAPGVPRSPGGGPSVPPSSP